jgi:hypothetical protein
MEDLIVFEAKGYPIIKVYNDYFEIKAIDYWEFRKFEFNNVKKIELHKPSENISPISLSIYSIFKYLFEKNEPNKLIITLQNEGNWEYLSSNKYNEDFNKTIRLINSKV